MYSINNMLSIYCIFTLMHRKKTGLRGTNSQNRTTSFLVIAAVWSQSNKLTNKKTNMVFAKIDNCDLAGTVLCLILWYCPAET